MDQVLDLCEELLESMMYCVNSSLLTKLQVQLQAAKLSPSIVEDVIDKVKEDGLLIDIRDPEEAKALLEQHMAEVREDPGQRELWPYIDLWNDFTEENQAVIIEYITEITDAINNM